MPKAKLFLLSFSLTFISTAILCIALGQPLIFLPVDYGGWSFIRFGILVAFLSFSLVYINLTFLKIVRVGLSIKWNESLYYSLGTLFILQIVTLLTGYMESALTRHVAADWFYYYQGVGNSLIYIVTGNLSAFLGGFLYGKYQKALARNTDIKFDFEEGTPSDAIKVERTSE